MAESIDFFQIYYLESQRAEIFPFATPYFNETLTPFFENSIIYELVMKSQAQKIAICSHALRQKMTMRIPPRRELTEEVFHEDFDVMSFTKNSSEHDMLGALEGWHPGSKALLREIWSGLGMNMPNKVKFPIYQNAFCARIDIYRDYVINFLEPAMNLMQTDPEIRRKCWENPNYTRTTLNKPIDTERLQRLLGVPYVPFHPFLLERCFSLWINDRNLKVIYL